MTRPAGVTAIAIIFLLAAAYLFVIAIVMLVLPGAISMIYEAPFMYGLELAGPYMTLIVGAGWALVGWGLFRLYKWARWVAMIALGLGVALAVPAISAAATDLNGRLLWYGLQASVRVAAALYLAQSPGVIEAFARK